MMQFLEPISLSKYTLPVVSGVCILLWLMFRGEGDWEPILGGLLVSSFMVYLIAELNNRNALLRNGSRMHSCMAILLTTVIIQLHTFSFAHLMMISIIITMHLLCRTTLIKSPILSFLTYLILAVISLFYSKILFLVPIYWICQIYMRSMSRKCFVASILALLMPYWLMLGYFVFKESYQALADGVSDLFVFSVPDYGSLTLLKLVQFVYILLVLAVGIVDYYRNSYKDKSKIRIIYVSVIIQAFFFFFLLILQPQDFYIILPLLIVYTSIISGHFFALTYTKYSHIASLVFLIISLLVFYLSLNPELL